MNFENLGFSQRTSQISSFFLLILFFISNIIFETLFQRMKKWKDAIIIEFYQLFWDEINQEFIQKMPEKVNSQNA